MRIYRDPDVMWREEEEYKERVLGGLETGDDVADVGTSVLYSGGKMLSLNLLGTEVWKLCEGRTVDEIVSVLIESFEVGEDVLKKDVTEFIRELKEKGFVRYEE